MKRKSFLMLLTGMFAISSGALVGCNDDDDDVNKKNSLSVTPASAIEFKAGDNQDVVLTVKTDAKSWAFEKNGEWIVAKQDGDKLTVNAQANTTESVRPGRITITAGNAEPVNINVNQKGLEVGEIVLSISPSDPIGFEATGNKAVELTVTTNAPDWTFSYPEEWMTAEKQGDKLTVNAKDNTGDARVGQIVVTSSEGEKTAKIAVSQKAGSENPTPGEEIAGSLSTADDLNIQFAHDAVEPVKKTLTFTLEKTATAETKVKLVFDERHVEEYNFDHATEYVVFPEKLCTIANDGVMTIPAGETSAQIEVTLTPSASDLEYVTTYMVPLQAVAQTEGIVVKDEAEYVDFLVSRIGSKKIRNICYFEVNDCNPLNAIEYILEDGQPFFDAVVLFAGNINWDASKQKVYMNANPNVQALLDNSEELLQPLRKKGIKVLLDILGNHDQAGIAGLSDWGCEQFGKELAQICLDYKLDGIGFDDEYSSYYGSGKWFAGPSSQQAARLCYETKKAMKELCPWETWVHLYYLGYIQSSLPSVFIDGVEHKPSEFIDNVCADYGGSARPVNGMGLSGCAGNSIQLNYGNSISSESAKALMNQGYGWIMWFAFDPSGTGTVSNNRSHSLRQFRNVAEGCYEQSVRDPKNVYNKISEGQYDPAPHPIN